MQCPLIPDRIDYVEQLVEEVSIPLGAAGNVLEAQNIPQRRVTTSESFSGGGFAAHGVFN